MSRGAALGLTALVFLLGLAGGALGAHLFYARSLQRPAPPPVGPHYLGANLVERLELTPEQAGQVRAILEESRQRALELRRETMPRVRELFADANARIEAVLEPEQRRIFRRELRRRWRRGPPFDRGRHRPPAPEEPL